MCLSISGIMYAFSPGLWSNNGHAWTLVAVDTINGTVKKQCDIAPPGKDVFHLPSLQVWHFVQLLSVTTTEMAIPLSIIEAIHYR